MTRRNAPWADCREIEGPDGIRATLYLGDCRSVMAALEPESVHAVVTDPPYELGFMGKAWDKAGGVASDPETWRLALDLLTPGGHLAAFAGSRTYHRIASAIDDAGFEIRDQLMWLYGSGFPKSLDVGKAIDAADKVGPTRERALRFTEWMRSTGLTSRRVNQITGSSMGSHYLTAKEQPEVATREMFERLRPHLPAVPAWVEGLVDARTVESENLKRRPKIADHEQAAHAATWRSNYDGGRVAPPGTITAAYSDQAKRWEGWGTALKPAHEPIALGRKPFKGAVRDAVLAHGTAAINVDGCRVGTGGGTQSLGSAKTGMFGVGGVAEIISLDAGRWPANVITDGSPDILEAFPASARDAIRFFYAPKADKAEREYGLAGVGALRDGGRASQSRSNVHPTVKPVDLMRWLCRLITPGAGHRHDGRPGVVLDPFMGSGSTGMAAAREGLRFVGIEQSPEYFEIAYKRIEAAIAALHRQPDIIREITTATARIKAEQATMTF